MLQKKDRSLRLSNLEAGATYEVQVRAQTDDEGPGPWSDAGEGTANRPPTKLNPFNYVSYAWGSSRSVDIAGHFADADGDTLRYSASSEYPGVVSTALNGSQFTTTGLNPGSSVVTYGAHDGYGGYVSHTFTCTITANVTRRVVEYSPAGTKVGDPVAGTPYDDGDDQTNDALTHTLHGEAADAFVIDSATGQITVKAGATLDWVTKSSYSGSVQYTVNGQNSVVNLTIYVTAVAPGKPGAPTLTRTTSSEPMNPALDVAWSAAGANGLTITGYQVQYRKKAAAGEEAAAWTPYTGALPASATGAALPDLDAGATYEVQVRAVAERPQQPDITLTVSPSSFDEHSPDSRGTEITVTATRQGTSGDVFVKLAFSGTATGSGTDYRVWDLGDIRIADGHTSGSRTFTFTGVNDTEDEGSESIIVSGTVAGLTVKGTVITIIDDERPGHVITAVGERSGPWSDTGEGTANRPPAATSENFTGAVAEVGASFIWHDEALSPGSGAYFRDADGDTLTYSASAQHPALLGVTLTSAAGTAVLTANLLNPGASDVIYTATDAYGGQLTRRATFTITASVSREIAENSAGGTNVGGPVTGTPYDDGDEETDDALSYTLTGEAAGKFVIDSATGQISVKEGAVLDYESDDIYIQVETIEDGSVRKLYAGEVRYTVDGIAAVIGLKIFLTDVDDDAHITLSFDPEYVQEGQTSTSRSPSRRPGTARWAITQSIGAWPPSQRKPPPAAPTLHSREVDPATRSRNSDYYMRVLPSDVRIAPGETSASTTVTYHICSDDLDEPNETISYTANVSHATFTEAVLTIGDPETITLSVSPDTIAEDAGATEATVTATLSAARATDTVVNLTLGGTATDPADYTATGTGEHHHPQG